MKFLLLDLYSQCPRFLTLLSCKPWEKAVFSTDSTHKLRITQFLNHQFSYSQQTLASVSNNKRCFCPILACHFCELPTLKQFLLEQEKIFFRTIHFHLQKKTRIKYKKIGWSPKETSKPFFSSSYYPWKKTQLNHFPYFEVCVLLAL